MMKEGFTGMVRNELPFNLVANGTVTYNEKESTMKKSILILCAACALAGCKQEQGGGTSTGEQPGSSSSMSNTRSSSGSSTNVSPSTSQGGATTPSGASSGSSSGNTDTNTSSTPSSKP